MDTTTCTTIVLILLWLYLCCQALGSLVALIKDYDIDLLPITTTLSTLLLGVCLWQCRQSGYLVSPMTLYHWVLLVLLVILQIMAVLMAVLEQKNVDGGSDRGTHNPSWTHPIYGIAVVLLGILGGTLYCGWKCNLFCRPCCKSQYVCYGSAIVVVIVILTVLAVTASLVGIYGGNARSGEAGGLFQGPHHLCKILIPITQCYSIAVVWNIIIMLPYTVPEVVALMASALAVSSILALPLLGNTPGNNSYKEYCLLAMHLIALGITWFFLEYKATFCCPKVYLCFGILAAVLLVSLVTIVVLYAVGQGTTVKYTLLGYSLLLMVPTLWYAYRCNLFSWCLPKKKGIKPSDTTENTRANGDITTE